MIKVWCTIEKWYSCLFFKELKIMISQWIIKGIFSSFHSLKWSAVGINDLSDLLGSIWSITMVLTLHHTREIDEHRLFTSHPLEKIMRASRTGTQGCAPSNIYCLLQCHYAQLYIMIFYMSCYYSGKGHLLYRRALLLRDLKGVIQGWELTVTEPLSNRDNCLWLKPEQDGYGLDSHLIVCLGQRRNSQWSLVLRLNYL